MSITAPGHGLVGRRFGNYVVTHLLASGGMGEVYVMRHASLPDLTRVLKVILPEYAARADIRDRFDREARAVAALGKHDNIVGIDDYGMTEDGQLWMMMPYVDGRPLDRYLAEQGGTLPPYRVMELLCTIALGLVHAHQRNIIHRDIKPSNIFVVMSDKGIPKCMVMDFGIARQRQAMVSTTQAALGTPSYMAVEQYEHAADAEVTADVYALACMVWELLTGLPPWSASDLAVLYHQKLHVPPPPPAGNNMPPAWEEFLRQSLAVDPACRPPSVRHFVLGLASRLPAVPPFVPSGMELIHQRARELELSDSTDTTLRRPGADTPAPVSPAAQQHTTLGSAAGSVGQTTASSRPRLVGFGVAAVIIAGIATYGAVATRGGHAVTSATAPAAATSTAPETTSGTRTTSSVAAEAPKAAPAAAKAASSQPSPALPTSAATSSEPPPPAPPAGAATANSASSQTSDVRANDAATKPPSAAPPATAPARLPTGSGGASGAKHLSTPATVNKSAPARQPPSTSKRKFDPDALGGEDNP